MAAHDAETDSFLTVDKTFKGLTDTEITEMTRHLKELTVSEKHRQAIVLPKIVVEAAYNEIQRKPKIQKAQ